MVIGGGAWRAGIAESDAGPEMGRYRPAATHGKQPTGTGMNNVVRLVNEWDSFEQTHPNGDIEGFCRYYLMKQGEKDTLVEDRPDTPPLPDRDNLMRLMGRITSAFYLYHKAAMAKTGLPFADGFFYLNILKNAGEIRKTELINRLLSEYTTGMEAINRLIREGLVIERPDASDKRAKLISVSPKGEQVLLECYGYVVKVNEMMLKDVDPDALKLCVMILSEIEIRHTPLAVAMKNRDFDEIYGEVMGS